MRKRMTLDELLKNVDASRIVGLTDKDILDAKEPPKARLFREQKEYTSEGKQFIYLALQSFADQMHTKLTTEYKFHSKRKFRFDFCLEELMIAVEYEGIYSETSRHTFFTGFNRDCRKYNLAVLCGYRLLRYTAKTYKDIVDDLSMISIETW